MDVKGNDRIHHGDAAVRTAAAMPVNLLWTGGWDSSFQLLRLLLLHKRQVVPHYLLDPTRPSARTELAAMARMRAHLFEQHPHTRQLLAPLQTFDVADLAPDPAINDAFDRIAAGTFIGSQYGWLARFGRQRGIEPLELSAGYRGGRIHGIVGPLVTQTDEGGGYRSYRIDPKHRETAEFALFGGFSFPLLMLNKAETATIAGEHGWLSLMDMTCFCHRPRDGQPCGCCNPCLYAVDEGFGWRIPRRNRIKGLFYRGLVRPMKAPVKAALRQLRTMRSVR